MSKKAIKRMEFVDKQEIPGTDQTLAAASPLPKGQAQGRLAYIDGLRGVAIFVVLILHTSTWGGRPASLGKLFNMGSLGVDLFLVLSGFCLFWPLVKQRDGGVKPLVLSDYTHRRFRRIAPPYYIALLFYFPVCYLAFRYGVATEWMENLREVFPLRGADTVGDWLAHFLFLHGLSNHYIFSIDSVFWSLSLEVQFYVLLPLLVWTARRISLGWALVLPFLVSLIFRLTLHFFFKSLLLMPLVDMICVSRWMEFGAGMIAASLLAGAWGRTILQRSLRPEVRRLLLVVLMVIGIISELVRPNFVIRRFLWAAIFGLMVLHAGCGNGRLRRLLDFRPLVWLGTISYSVYLMHNLVFRLVSIPVSHFGAAPLMRPLLFSIAAPLTIPICYLFFLAFERPFLNPTPRSERTQEALAPASETGGH